MVATPSHADALRVTVESVEALHLHAIGTVPGVAIERVAGRNGPGVAYIRTTGDGTHLQWRPPDADDYGPAVDISAGGSFLVEGYDDLDKWIRVAVTASWLLPCPAESTVHLQDCWENDTSQDDVTAAEATSGDTLQWTLTLSNPTNVGLSQLKAWIAGAGGQAGWWSLFGSFRFCSSTAPAIQISANGSDWVSPGSEASALALADVAAGSTVTLYVRRVVAATTPVNTGLLNHLQFSYAGV